MKSHHESRITNAHISDFRPESRPFNTEADNYRIDCEMAAACLAGTLRKMNPATGKTEQAFEHHFLSMMAIERYKTSTIKHPQLVAEEEAMRARAEARAALTEERPSSFGPIELQSALERTVRGEDQTGSLTASY